MDCPADSQTWTIDDQFLVGASLLAAPVPAGEPERQVYLPEGDWFDYWTGQQTTGKQRVKVTAPLDRVPLFVKSGTLLPLAHPTLHTEDATAFHLTVRVYGAGDRPSSVYEQEGSSMSSIWDDTRQTGTASGGRAYQVTGWEKVHE